MLDRRQFLLSAAALAGLTACGGSPAVPQDSGSPVAGFPRTVRHELGQTRIPAAPRRVVCGTDGGELSSLLALGLRPVGFGRRNDPLRPWLAGLAEGLDDYDLSSGETQYERLIAWQPDLLLVQNGFATEETMPRFGEIAPTVATSFVDWRVNLQQVAQAVGLEDRGRELEAEKDAAVAAARQRLDPRAEGLVLNAVAAFDDGTVHVLNDRSPLGKLAPALGLAPLPRQVAAGEATDQVSMEQLDRIDGDVLLVQHHGDGDGAAALKQTGLWNRLDVVRSGRVVDLTEDESHQTYFDSVLTVEPNTALLERVVADALG